MRKRALTFKKLMLTIFVSLFSVLNGFALNFARINADSSKLNEPSIQFNKKKPVFIIAKPENALEKKVTQYLTVYLQKVLGSTVHQVANIQTVPQKAPVIILTSHPQASIKKLISQKSKEAFALKSTNINSHQAIIAAGNTSVGLKRAVQKLIIKSEQVVQGLTIPALNIAESPWIPQREWTICPWSPDRVRRSFYNPEADKRNNIWLYSDQQIADYVDMFDWFGFSGTQLMETCNNYAAMGSPGAFQDKELKFAKAARQNGQQVSYWVWAAQFNDYGWFDKDVTYTPAKGNTAYNDPKVHAVFEKYYNGYARMAPYADLLIAHFYDPGSLTNREDVFSYLKLLQDKFKAKNPEIKMGVDFWAAGSPESYMQQLIDHGFGNSLLLEMSMPVVYTTQQRQELHRTAKKLNINMGMWGWYMTEYETDQRPMMHVNAQALKGFYQEMKANVNDIHPYTYWSEMEAYHLNNIFSLYASGQLLWNPDRNTDDILRELTYGIWGPHNGPLVLEAVKLIEDVRSGPTWNTFWWTTKEYRLGTNNPQSDFNRAEDIVAKLEQMQTDKNYVSKFPLPFPPSTFIELMLPHLRQIKLFAAFRIKADEIGKAAKNNVSKTTLSKMAADAWQPIPDYNTWIGSFGQTESVMQEKILRKLAKDYSFDINTPDWLGYRDANRYLQRIQNVQHEMSSPYKFKSDESRVRSDLGWGSAKANECMQVLTNNGAVVKDDQGLYQLADWAEFSQK